MNSFEALERKHRPSILNSVLFDARCLQDEHYRFRGVGQFGRSLIEAMRQEIGQDVESIALVDPRLPALSPSDLQLFDRILTSVYDNGRVPDCFVELSPMTHSSLRLRRIINNADVFKVSVVHDFIQLFEPERYLAAPEARAGFVAACGWLGLYDCFASNSHFTSKQLSAHLQVDPERIFVTGCPVRENLVPAADVPDRTYDQRSGIVVAGGGDPRKNPECALLAHAVSRDLQLARTPIAVTGNYATPTQNEMLQKVREAGGDTDLVTFCSHLSDEELIALYRGSRIVVVPSFAEGFSMPPIEAIANGAVVLVSDTTAHPELVPNPEHRFGPRDYVRLSGQLERFIQDANEWSKARTEQADIWRAFTLEKVGRRFWSNVADRFAASSRGIPKSTPYASSSSAPWAWRGYRPSLAIVTPLPPSLSGVADYSAVFLKKLATLADVHVFTSSLGALNQHHFKSFQAVSSRAYVSTKFERTITVLGNSILHLDGFRHLLDYGGSCVAHDARMIDFYYHELGAKHAKAIAERELGRHVNVGEIDEWLRDQNKLKCLFLSEICEQANPLFVHSPDTVVRVQKAYDTKAHLLPFALYGPVFPHEADERARAEARLRLGVREGEKVIVTFGIVSSEKIPGVCVEALALLRDTGVNARLVFCGFAPPPEAEKIGRLCREKNLEGSVTVMETAVSRDLYRDWLLAADAGIQLRNYGLGGLSGALNDCIGAALPTVANETLAVNMRAPDFVKRISNDLRVTDLAEALGSVLESGHRPIEEASEHATRYSFEVYCREMLTTLGFGDAL